MYLIFFFEDFLQFTSLSIEFGTILYAEFQTILTIFYLLLHN